MFTTNVRLHGNGSLKIGIYKKTTFSGGSENERRTKENKINSKKFHSDEFIIFICSTVFKAPNIVTYIINLCDARCQFMSEYKQFISECSNWLKCSFSGANVTETQSDLHCHPSHPRVPKIKALIN